MKIELLRQIRGSVSSGGVLRGILRGADSVCFLGSLIGKSNFGALLGWRLNMAGNTAE